MRLLTHYRFWISAFLLILVTLGAFGTVAAAPQLNYTSDTMISLTNPVATWRIVAGSVADSLTVNAGGITVMVPPGTTFTLVATTTGLAYAGTTGTIANITCTPSGVATLQVSSQNTQEQTLTVSPTAALCNAPQGGGATTTGGGWSPATPTPTPNPTPSPAATTTPAAPTPSPNAPGAGAPQQGGGAAGFTRPLYYGMRGDPQVLLLQVLLTKLGYYSGPITGNFFSLTRAAVRKFQQANNIPTLGRVGPLTRAALNGLAGR